MKPGYKQTEVGVIPEEWGVGALESVARIIDPQPDHRTPPETAGGEPYIGISDFIDDCTVNWDPSRKIVSRAVDKQQLRFQVGPGNIIFGKIGTIGSPKFLPTVPFRFGLSANVLLIQPRIEPNFVLSWLRSKPCQRAVIGELHSTSQAAFGINKMRRVLIPLPPDPEQRAIATALSDVDGLLGGLDRLIAKKRDLKQAAMQQLLTGQIRLPGFHGDWEVKSLSKICSMKSGEGITSANIDQFSKYPCYGGNGLRGYATRFTHDGSYALVGRQGALCGNVCRVVGQFFASEHAIVVTSFEDTDIRWLTAMLARMNLNQYSESSAQPGLSVSKILTLKIDVPPTKTEQTAIAEVLTEMDEELAGLERRRDKTRALKQAMMQELLTGRTRLIPPEEAHA